jgi:hypothetical protein
MGENDPKKPFRFSEQVTPGGYGVDEVTSALQKAVRRGHEDEAVFWASELDLAGFGNYVWKRLRVIASEDVGLADTNVAIAVRVLYEKGDRPAMRMAIPDIALDMHTARGRRMGRGKAHFLEEAGRLEGETLPDTYREEGAVAWTRSKTKREEPAEPPADQLELGEDD